MTDIRLVRLQWKLERDDSRPRRRGAIIQDWFFDSCTNCRSRPFGTFSPRCSFQVEEWKLEICVAIQIERFWSFWSSWIFQAIYNCDFAVSCVPLVSAFATYNCRVHYPKSFICWWREMLWIGLSKNICIAYNLYLALSGRSKISYKAKTLFHHFIT